MKLMLKGVCLVLLTGCFGGDVDVVKKSYLEAWPGFTVGQLLDGRGHCGDVQWNNIKDDRGRSIVEYHCQLVPVEQHFRETLQKSIEFYREDAAASRRLFDNEKIGFERRLTQNESNLLDLTNELNDMEAKLGSLSEDLLRDYKRIKSRLTSCPIDKNEFSLSESVLAVETVNLSCLNGRVAREREEYVNLHLERLLDDLRPRTTINDKIDRVRSLISEAKFEAEWLTGQISNHSEMAATKYAEIDDRERKKVELIEKIDVEFRGIYERSRWIIINGVPQYSGSDILYRFGAEETEFEIPSNVVFEVAKNSGDSLHPLYQFVFEKTWPSVREGMQQSLGRN